MLLTTCSRRPYFWAIHPKQSFLLLRLPFEVNRSVGWSRPLCHCGVVGLSSLNRKKAGHDEVADVAKARILAQLTARFNCAINPTHCSDCCICMTSYCSAASIAGGVKMAEHACTMLCRMIRLRRVSTFATCLTVGIFITRLVYLYFANADVRHLLSTRPANNTIQTLPIHHEVKFGI